MFRLPCTQEGYVIQQLNLTHLIETLCLYCFLGIEHVTYSGKNIPQRHQLTVYCRCNCYALLTEEERKSVIEKFNKIKNHELQNAYLRGCVQKKDADKIQRRPRSQRGVTRNSFVYAVTVKQKTVRVCKAAFLGLHGIKASRL